MSALVSAAALGLVAAWPVGMLGWVMGAVTERLTADPRPRAAAWSLAFLLPAGALAAVLFGAVGLASAAAGPPSVASSHLPLTAILKTAPAVRALHAASPPWMAQAVAWSVLGLSILGMTHHLWAWREGHGRLMAVTRRASPVDDPALLERLRSAGRRPEVATPPILVSDEIDQPLLVGLRRPAILLPTRLVSTTRAAPLALICLHELAHLHRRDNVRLVLENALAGLFWLAAPVITVLRAHMTAAREELCDQLALVEASPQARHQYAHDLVEALKGRLVSPQQSAFAGHHRKLTTMRLTAILQPSQAVSAPRLGLILALSAALATLVGGGSLALARQATAKPPSNTFDPVKGSSPILIDPMPLMITADAARTSGTSPMVVWIGNPTISGVLDRPSTTLLVNGVAPLADFDPMRLPPNAIERLEVTPGKDTPDRKLLLNVVLKAH
ncbi:M56 family metallopeptidase [Caulobacter sp. LARHSG274]